MMKKRKGLMMIAAIAMTTLLLFVGGCAVGEGTIKSGYDFSRIDKIGVVDVTGNIEGDTAKNQIADYFAMELMRKGYSPVERAQVQSLLKEQSFQAMEVTTPEGVAQVGQILNVQAVLIANIDYGEETTITAKLIDVEDGSMLWLGSGAGKTGYGWLPIATATGGAVGGAAAAGDSTRSKVGGAVAGGVAGGAAGVALTPQKAEQAQKVIKKMCESMPHRTGQAPGTNAQPIAGAN
ncbi:MAG: hypothetical protein A2Z25_01325 [Planctomycetes bacterium RBG_16_55_9]|nr:MAG: hypothetical protein A2Z25_01325 [Planctomycetes bacterium RBG_16_55_9]